MISYCDCSLSLPSLTSLSLSLSLPPPSFTPYTYTTCHPLLFQERHLQEVILAQQTNSVKKKHVYIPTPDAAITVAHYEEIAKPVQRTVQYIRVPGKDVRTILFSTLCHVRYCIPLRVTVTRLKGSVILQTHFRLFAIALIL